MDSRYWQVKFHEGSQDKIAFYMLEGKKHWKVMPMGIRNVHAFFVAMVHKFKAEWTEVYKNKGNVLATLIINKYKEQEELPENMKQLLNMDINTIQEEGNSTSAVIVDDVLLAANS